MKKFWQQYGWLLVTAGGVIALDQWTKYLVRANLALREEWLPSWLGWLSPWARFVHWYNTGAAFGLFQSRGPLFAALAVIVSAMIIYYYPQLEKEDWALKLALGLQMGGALGNMIDRMTVGHVTDFISVGTFPVFNVADSAITVGVGFLILGWWLQEKRLRGQAAAAAASAENLSDEEVASDDA